MVKGEGYGGGRRECSMSVWFLERLVSRFFSVVYLLLSRVLYLFIPTFFYCSLLFSPHCSCSVLVATKGSWYQHLFSTCWYKHFLFWTCYYKQFFFLYLFLLDLLNLCFSILNFVTTSCNLLFCCYLMHLLFCTLYAFIGRSWLYTSHLLQFRHCYISGCLLVFHTLCIC